MKLLSHLLVLAVGAGLGVWWGVNHPSEAARVAAEEQLKVSEAKIEVLQELASRPSTSSDTVKQMLETEKQKMQDAQSQLGH